jgi:hypothetical protein
MCGGRNCENINIGDYLNISEREREKEICKSSCRFKSSDNLNSEFSRAAAAAKKIIPPVKICFPG